MKDINALRVTIEQNGRVLWKDISKVYTWDKMKNWIALIVTTKQKTNNA